MRILFLGDVMGRSGREAVLKHLPKLKEKLTPDVIVVNGENAASGLGITGKIAQEMLEAGVTCLTTGNHVWAQRELLTSINQTPRIIRPLNYPEGTPGHGTYLHILPDGRKVLIANTMGTLFVTPQLEHPFTTTELMLSPYRLGQNIQAIFIDFHAEATSEKMGFGHHFDGKVSAVVGTHTHIPTADWQILPKGTAYMTDAGMCGDYDSVIGMKKEPAIWRLTHVIPGERLAPAESEGSVSGCFIETDDRTGLATSIRPIRQGPVLEETA